MNPPARLPSLHIALDATPLTEPAGGLLRYVTELSSALARDFPRDIVSLISDQAFELPARAPANLRAEPRPIGFLSRKWWSLGLPHRLHSLGASVFHGTNFEVPYVPLTPTVLTLHDLSPWMDPAWHRCADRIRRRTPFLMGLGLATMVITPSSAVRRQAIERFGLCPYRTVPVPLAAAPHLRPVATSSGATTRYLVFVGTIEPRKNLRVIVEAWREVRRHHRIELVLAGRCRPGDSPPSPEVGLRLTGMVPEGQLAQLYSGAVACLYPSLYEGFGLPVLEAMQCGCPVITSRDAAIGEVAADAALRLDAGDVKAWIEAIRAVIEKPALREEWRERGIRRARCFTWEETARRTREVYDEAIRRSS